MGKTQRGRRPNQLSLPLGLAGPRSSLEARATDRLKLPLLFIYVPRYCRHLGRKFNTIAVRQTKPANGQSFGFKFLELEGPR